MQTENILTTCIHETDGIYNCTTPAYFTGGEMFISFLLLIGLVLATIALLRKGIFSVSVHREYQGVNQWEGKEKYKI